MVEKLKLVPGKGPVKPKQRDGNKTSGYDIRAKLLEVLEDSRSPPQARAAAGRTLAEIDGLIGRHQAAPDRGALTPVGQLSRADLEAELARLRARTSKGQG